VVFHNFPSILGLLIVLVYGNPRLCFASNMPKAKGFAFATQKQSISIADIGKGERIAFSLSPPPPQGGKKKKA